MARKNTGWGKNGRPFSEKEFKNSYIKESHKNFTYNQYLKEVLKTLSSKNKRLKESLKRGMR
jgi:hypothetical protein